MDRISFTEKTDVDGNGNAASQPAETYEFFCTGNEIVGDDFLPNQQESFFGGFVSNGKNILVCNEGLGIRPVISHTRHSFPLLESKGNITALKKHVSSAGVSGMSMEMILTVDSDVDSKRHILSIGETNFERVPLDEDHLGCKGFDLLFSQTGEHFELAYTENGLAKSCRHVIINPNATFLGKKTHVVISISDSATNLFLNGMSVFQMGSNNKNASLSDWAATHTVQLFSNYGEFGVFTGTIHSLSIYDCFLHQGAVEAAYELSERIFDDLVRLLPWPLVASPSSMYTLPEGDTGRVELLIGGRNSSMPECPTAVEIVSLPNHGNIFSMNETQALEAGSIIRIHEEEMHTAIRYESRSREYFNAPSQNANGVDLDVSLDSFDFRVVELGTKHREARLIASVPVTQLVRVLNVNHKPKLLVPVQISRDAISGVDESGRPRLAINDIRVVDKDKDVDKVRVDISARNGSLSLNERHLHLADFASCRSRMSYSWLCHGRGAGDRSMTFLALPSDVENIFADLEYFSFFKDASDEIVITIYDGVGGGCLAEEELPQYADEFRRSYTSIRNGCFQVRGTIRFGNWEVGDTGGSSSPSPTIPYFVIWLIFGCAITACCIGVKCISKRCLKQTKEVSFQARSVPQ